MAFRVPFVRLASSSRKHVLSLVRNTPAIADQGEAILKPAMPPLHKAARIGSLERLRKALAAGADVRQLDGDARSALHLAAGKGSVKVVHELLRTGADATTRDAKGKTALHLAAAKGSSELVKAFLDDGKVANMLDTCDSSLRTALHWAAASGGHSAVHSLLHAGADPAIRDCNHETPGHIAERMGKKKAAKLLADWQTKLESEP